MYQLGLYEKAMPKELTWLEKLTYAKKAGFDYIEMSIDETDEKLARLNMSPKEIEEIQVSMNMTGIPIRSICLSAHRKFPFGSHNKAIREHSIEIMQKAINLAAVLGVRIIQLAGYDVYYEDSDEDTRSYFLSNLIIATHMAAEAGIILGFETMENNFMDTVAKAMHYVNKINSPYLGVYPDVGNCTNSSLIYKHDVGDDIKTGAGHIFAAHLKETVPGKYREIPFGTGHVDFQKVINTLWNLGVRRYTAEFWYVGNPNWQEDLLFANKFLRSFIDKTH